MLPAAKLDQAANRVWLSLRSEPQDQHRYVAPRPMYGAKDFRLIDWFKAFASIATATVSLCRIGWSRSSSTAPLAVMTLRVNP